jgi:hypothetical protein
MPKYYIATKNNYFQRKSTVPDNTETVVYADVGCRHVPVYFFNNKIPTSHPRFL